ncbi:periplasmic binding protein-like I [Halteromyces radiatus]|uniref:periplasmic binding protein-like I n=1 Tax=Halteromyces radiatus TaxID=101107 RepID=UPI00221FDAC8|nr:periplasmic binding protein-like I [Halteromyces radiatus]KAI8083135.1 periplasmic binding protein-like I [Halteromyces radiatus]
MAVNEINAAQVIPGAYITLIEKDSYPDASLGQAAVTNAVYALVTLLQQGVIGVIGDVTSSWTALSALMTSALELPQCSFTASSVSFSDKGQFKYFFRTIPTDVVMIDAMLRFVVYQGWTKIGVIYSDDSLGQQLYQRVIQQTEVMNIQLINYQSFPSTTSTPTSDEMKTSLDSLSNNGARVILLAATGQIQSDLLVQAAVAGYLSSEYTWLLVDDDATSYLQETIDTYNNNTHSTNNTRQLSLKSDFNGLIYFTNWLTLNGYPPYDKFLSSWSHLDSNVLAYSCLMMMANGFQNILRPSTNHTDGLLQLASGNLGDFLTPQAFNTGYVGPDGPMQLDANGDMMAG